MLAAERRFGVVFLHNDLIATVLPGTMISRPFGLAPPACKRGCAGKIKFKKVEKSGSIMGTKVVVRYSCSQHGPLTKCFPASLVQWWDVGRGGHLAYWDLMMTTTV